MPRTSTRDLLPAISPTSSVGPTSPAGIAPAPGATEVLEAATAEAAIAAVHERLGPDARIVDARRILRGGVGGFFAKEVIQLHAAPGSPRPAEEAAAELIRTLGDRAGAAAAAAAAAGPWADAITSMSGAPFDPPAAPEVADAGSPVDRLLSDVDRAPETMDFATFLQHRLGDADAQEEPPRRETVASTDGGPPWSVTALLHLGLPVELVHALEVSAPADDLAWTTALAETLRPSCRPLPGGPAMLVGPLAPAVADVASTFPARSATWSAAIGAGRWVHLVVGGDGWRARLGDGPLAVSWTRSEDMPEALRCATELGMVLGYGPVRGEMRRARPMDVALAVRELVDTR